MLNATKFTLHSVQETLQLHYERGNLIALFLGVRRVVDAEIWRVEITRR
jgi:hypothetical protein